MLYLLSVTEFLEACWWLEGAVRRPETPRSSPSPGSRLRANKLRGTPRAPIRILFFLGMSIV